MSFLAVVPADRSCKLRSSPLNKKTPKKLISKGGFEKEAEEKLETFRSALNTDGQVLSVYLFCGFDAASYANLDTYELKVPCSPVFFLKVICASILSKPILYFFC